MIISLGVMTSPKQASNFLVAAILVGLVLAANSKIIETKYFSCNSKKALKNWTLNSRSV